MQVKNLVELDGIGVEALCLVQSQEEGGKPPVPYKVCLAVYE